MDINWTQIGSETGITIGGILTKGDVITFLDLSKEDEIIIREALKTHIPNPPEPGVTMEDIMNKLNDIEAKI